MSKIQVEPTIEENVEFLEPCGDGVEYDLQIRSELGSVEVNGDPHALRQVILNL